MVAGQAYWKWLSLKALASSNVQRGTGTLLKCEQVTLLSGSAPGGTAGGGGRGSPKHTLP